MDDDVVTPSSPPVNLKSAYVLFYIQTDKPLPTTLADDDDVFSSFGGQKRTRDDMESTASRLGRKTAGVQVRTKTWDIFPASKKTRIEDTSRAKQGVAGPSRPTPVGVASSVGRPLVSYSNSDDIEDAGEVVSPSTSDKPASPTISPAKPNDETSPTKSTLATTSPSNLTVQTKSSPLAASKASKVFSPTRPSSFYGPLQKKDKRPGGNPYANLSGSGNLHAKRDSSSKEITSQLQANMGFVQFGGGAKVNVKGRMKGKRPSQ